MNIRDNSQFNNKLLTNFKQMHTYWSESSKFSNFIALKLNLTKFKKKSFALQNSFHGVGIENDVSENQPQFFNMSRIENETIIPAWKLYSML